MFHHELSLHWRGWLKSFPPESNICSLLLHGKRVEGDGGEREEGKIMIYGRRKFSILIISTYVSSVFPSHLLLVLFTSAAT